jgi:hypothetical protein
LSYKMLLKPITCLGSQGYSTRMLITSSNGLIWNQYMCNLPLGIGPLPKLFCYSIPDRGVAVLVPVDAMNSVMLHADVCS